MTDYSKQINYQAIKQSNSLHKAVSKGFTIGFWCVMLVGVILVNMNY